eukprot:15361862-Ditylum_brightwellii.AAC.1
MPMTAQRMALAIGTTKQFIAAQAGLKRPRPFSDSGMVAIVYACGDSWGGPWVGSVISLKKADKVSLMNAVEPIGTPTAMMPL